MNELSPKRKRITLKRVLIAIVLLFIIVPIASIIYIVTSSNIKSEAEYTRFKNEIARVEASSNIKSSATYCRSVEFAPICYVEYPTMTYENVETMLTENGYEVDTPIFPDKPRTWKDISAVNQETKMSADSEDSGKSGVTTIKFKDIATRGL